MVNIDEQNTKFLKVLDWQALLCWSRASMADDEIPERLLSAG